MVAASEVIALRTHFAALAFGGACQLLQFAVKFFDLAAQLVRRDLLQWSHDLSAMDTQTPDYGTDGIGLASMEP